MANTKTERVEFVPLGNFTYAKDGPPTQRFALEQSPVVDGMALVVDANYGHPDYTCLYRFQVHGEPV